MRSHILLRPSLLIGTLVVGSLLASVACGAADDPTAEPTATATATVAPTVATPTATAAAPPAPTPSDQPRYGGILKFEGSSDPSSFDVHNATSAAHSIHNGKMYSTLIDNVDGKSLAPGVAESWEISADGSVWTFIIRNDIRFQSYTSGPFAEIPGPRDGTILTAADAEYSLEKIMGLVDGVVSARCGWMKEFIDIERDDLGVEAVDDRTLKVYMKQPSSALANILILDHCGVMPEGTTRDMLAERAYGSGGYKLKEFQRGALWEYERNDDFFRPGLPYLDEVHHVNLRGSTVEQAAFLSGQLDMQSGLPTADNSPIYDQMAADGEIVMIPTPGTCVIQGVYMNSQVAPFDNPQLRKAVHLGIDRKGYIEAVYDGNAVPVTYTYPNTWFGYTEEEIWQLPGFRQPKDQDLAEAKRIMAEEYPSGLTVTMQARDTGNYPKMAEFITGELQKIGIEATIDIIRLFKHVKDLIQWIAKGVLN